MAERKKCNLKNTEATQFKRGSQAVESGRKGGIASGEAKRRKKSMAELAKAMLESQAKGTAAVMAQEFAGNLDKSELTVQAAMVGGMINASIKGDHKAFETVQGLLEKANNMEGDMVYQLPAAVLGSAFVDINRRIEPNKSYVFKGGRGGLKSSYISLKIVELLKNNSQMHCCIARKVGNTLRDSVYAQIKWAINVLGMKDDFEYKVSPLDIVYKKTGQRIYFRGADDPMKLKSIKPEFGYIGILWLEEEDQFDGPKEVRSIRQSILRGGDMSYSFASYNPPKSKQNWVNQEELIDDPNRVITSCSYLQAPREWLGQTFIDDAEHLKEVNPSAYEHEYLGIPNGDGGNVFDNIEVREITDEEIKSFDVIYQGVDWGLSPDPFVFLRLYYDADHEVIYFLDEIYARHLSNAESGQMIIDRGYDDYTVTCDSAEKKSVNDFRDLGIPAQAAIKGPGSIEYGMKWLIHRKIVIDPKRTPESLREFTNYEYARDKDGNVVSGYPDKYNHTIDACRYALERHCNRRGSSA